MCFLKDSLLSILIPRIFTQFSELIIRSVIFNGWESFILAFFNYNGLKFLNWLTIISFHLNHSIAAWLSVSGVERMLSIVLSAAVLVLSSANLAGLFWWSRNRDHLWTNWKEVDQVLEIGELQIKLIEIHYEHC